MSLQVRRAETTEQIAYVRALFLDYLHFIEAYLGQTLSFQGTEREFADFPQTYDALWLAEVNGHQVGAVGLKPFDECTGELKRLWVTPEGRGHGVAKRSAKPVLKARVSRVTSASYSIRTAV